LAERDVRGGALRPSGAEKKESTGKQNKLGKLDKTQPQTHDSTSGGNGTLSAIYPRQSKKWRFCR
jgi:hypothetical protein